MGAGSSQIFDPRFPVRSPQSSISQFFPPKITISDIRAAYLSSGGLCAVFSAWWPSPKWRHLLGGLSQEFLHRYPPMPAMVFRKCLYRHFLYEFFLEFLGANWRIGRPQVLLYRVITRIHHCKRKRGTPRSLTCSVVRNHRRNTSVQRTHTLSRFISDYRCALPWHFFHGRSGLVSAFTTSDNSRNIINLLPPKRNTNK